MSRPTPVSTRTVTSRGIFEAEPADVVPPPDAYMFVIQLDNGRRIAGGWVESDHADELTRGSLWAYLDAREKALMRASGGRVLLFPPACPERADAG